MLRELKNFFFEGATITFELSKDLYSLADNDYLGIASRRDFRQHEVELLDKYGLSGSRSSRLLAGNHSIYDELECLIAKRFNRETALTFVSGYHLNQGVISALATNATIILADKLVHSSIIDGILLSKSKFERFRHNDYEHLERLIKKFGDSYEQIMIVVESVYSMDGDLADLRKLVELKRKYPKILLYVDEAHSIGVRGENGLGLAEETGTIQDIDCLVGTFGKALASQGAYLVCSQVIRDYLINKCRTLIFTTAIPPIRCAFNKLVFEYLSDYKAERKKLHKDLEALRFWLKAELGVETTSQSHILPLVFGSAEATLRAEKIMQENGFYVPTIRPPSVAQGSCRLRLSLSVGFPLEQLKEAIKNCYASLGLLPKVDKS